MNKLDRQVAELMGIEIIDDVVHQNGVMFVPRDRVVLSRDISGMLFLACPRIPWQPTSDPRCERIVVEWLQKQNLAIQYYYGPYLVCGNICLITIKNANGINANERVIQQLSDSPGIALCLAVVEAFGGKKP
jgi:hypothetical protein